MEYKHFILVEAHVQYLVILAGNFYVHFPQDGSSLGAFPNPDIHWLAFPTNIHWLTGVHFKHPYLVLLEICIC